MAYPTVTNHPKIYPYTSIMAAPYSCDPTGAADCAAAIEFLKANQSNSGTIYVPKGSFKIGTNLTIPIGMTLEFASGASFAIAAGVTLVVLGAVITPSGQYCFTGSGILSPGNTFSSSESERVLVPGTWVISANTTIPSNITLKPLRGAVFAIATGVTLTVNGLIAADDYQIFSWVGTGAVSFTSQHKIKTAWFGNTAAGVNKALVSTPTNTPVICELPGGTIALGTTSIIMDREGQTLQGQGNNFAGENVYGTYLTYIGTSYAIIVGKSGSFSSHATLKDFGLGGLGVGTKGIKMGFADPGWARYPLIDNVTVASFTGNGIDVFGSEYGIYRRCQFSYNGGVGMLTDPEGGYINRVESCSFSYNDQEGVLFKHGQDWSFINCDLQGNGYEGFKIVGDGVGEIDNLVIEGNWFEGNQADAGRTNGYFHLLSSNAYPGLINIRNNSFRAVINPWNGTAGNKMMSVMAAKVVVGPNSYGSFGMGTASQIGAITRANPAQVTLTGHGWVTNDWVLFYGITQTGGWSARVNNRTFKITKIDNDNFTINCDTTACVAAYDPVVDAGTVRKINVPRPWNYCGAIVLHLIGEDIDKWSYLSTTKVIGDFNGWHYADYAVRITRTTGTEALYEHIFYGGTLTGKGAIHSDETQERPAFQMGGRLSRLHIRAEGTKTGAGGNKTIILYWGTQAIATIGPANNTNAWVIDAYVQMTDETAQIINATTIDASTLAATRTAGTQNLANDCKVYITGLAANAADIISCHAFSIMPQ